MREEYKRKSIPARAELMVVEGRSPRRNRVNGKVEKIGMIADGG